jgi:hypothetical protein
MTKDEALRMAIEAFEPEESTWWSHTKTAKAYQACNEALEQPAQEPIHNCPNCNSLFTKEIHSIPAPAWQGLSDDEIWDIANFLGKNKEWDYPVMFAKTIERALREKNHE